MTRLVTIDGPDGAGTPAGAVVGEVTSGNVAAAADVGGVSGGTGSSVRRRVGRGNAG
ncbi:hypothetical protein AFE02nite_21300 [Actinotalea fermentans]|uniref:Uncharacterized protein n=1 Tax=Actinotalea fermentans TaxID=43671 RepID=A0A511YZ37_9CELL|nr:hypothetical protein AFE02nite_21300 [Actinotalea fermentans]